MNWKQIKEKYPKAFKMLFKWANVPCGLGNIRRLYDFFDEQGIYISTDSNNLGDRITFSYIIPDYSTGQSKVEYDFGTRMAAETAAFTEAFKILDNQ